MLLYRTVDVNWAAELRNRLTMTLAAMLKQGSRQLMFRSSTLLALHEDLFWSSILSTLQESEAVLRLYSSTGGGPVYQRDIERRSRFSNRRSFLSS